MALQVSSVVLQSKIRSPVCEREISWHVIAAPAGLAASARRQMECKSAMLSFRKESIDDTQKFFFLLNVAFLKVDRKKHSVLC